MKAMMKRIRFLFTLHRSIPFMFDFFRSREIFGWKKLLLSGLIIGYILFPFDLIPDFILFFGLLDDAAMALLLLQFMVKLAPETLKEKHGMTRSNHK